MPFETVEGERGTSVSSSNLKSPIEQCMPRLQILHLNCTEISELSFSAGVCPNLQHLDMRGCNHVVEVGTLPNTLQLLCMTGCDSLVEVGTFPNTLRTLELYRLHNLRKIEGLCGLTKLQWLQIRWCKELEELRGIETLISLKELDASRCAKLKTIRGLGCLTKFQVLDFHMCCGLEELLDIKQIYGK